jgi:hypothetical protein
MDIVRVFRIIEYVGDRAAVEHSIKGAIHGELVVNYNANVCEGSLTIKAATIGTYPEILTDKEEVIVIKES